MDDLKFGSIYGVGAQVRMQPDNKREVRVPEWLGEEPELPEPAQTVDAEIVVIGAGHAGLAAVRRAAELGKKVALLESQTEDRYNAYGFNIGHINSQWQKEQGIPAYDPIEFLNSYQLQCAGRANPDLIRTFAERGGEAFDWFISTLTDEERSQITALNWPVPDGYAYANGPFTSYPGAAELPGKLMRTAMRAGLSRARESGAEIFFGMRAVSLVRKNGAVCGVSCLDTEGRHHLFNSSRAVVLAAGDFSGDKQMLHELCTEAADTNLGYDFFGIGRDGSGIKLGLRAGARMEVGPRAAMGGAHAVPMGPGGTLSTLWLNRDGLRYCNEGFGGPSVAGVQGARQPSGKLYSVWDSKWEYVFSHQMASHYNLKYYSPQITAELSDIMRRAREAGEAGVEHGITRIYAADDLDTLARYLGLVGSAGRNLVSSVNRYNGMCREGVDRDYGKDASMLLPIDEPPFYAFGDVKHLRMVMVTLAGLEVDRNQNCVDSEFDPIPGLYATGNCCGGRFPIQYTSPINGISIGMCLGLGYALGEHLAK